MITLLIGMILGIGTVMLAVIFALRIIDLKHSIRKVSRHAKVISLCDLEDDEGKMVCLKIKYPVWHPRTWLTGERYDYIYMDNPD